MKYYGGGVGAELLNSYGRVSESIILEGVSIMKAKDGKKFMDAEDIIEKVLSKPSVFKAKEALYPEYIPPSLPYREEQIRLLAQYFKFLLYNPGSISQRVFLHGPVGVGKTVTSRAFGSIFSSKAKMKGVNLQYIHVNCHRNRTVYNIVSEIAKHLNIPLPQRGLSAFELYSAILEFLEENDVYVILALDEFDYFIKVSGSDALYFFIRTYDEYPEYTKRINFILIGRSLSELESLDSATSSYLLRHMIAFKPYTAREIRDILKQRLELAFWEGVVAPEVVDAIAEIVGVDKGGDGNARAAIELLLRAGEAADYEGSSYVTLEHLRKAYASVAGAESSSYIVIAKDMILHLPLHELLIYEAVIRALKRTGKQYVRMGEVENEYELLCELYREKPRGHTQVYEYVRDLKQRGLIETRASGKGYRGRSTLIGIFNVPLNTLEKEVLKLIEQYTHK